MIFTYVIEILITTPTSQDQFHHVYSTQRRDLWEGEKVYPQITSVALPISQLVNW